MNNIGKVAIITGASRGIGAEIAKRLSRDGYNLVVNYARSNEAASEAVKEIEFEGGNALAYQADISDPAEVIRMFEDIEKDLGSIDIVVNNAGVMELTPLADTTDESIARHVDINLKGSLYIMREAAKRLSHGGRIINLSTSVVGLNLEKYGVYAATKASVETLTRILSKELRGRNITVNAVAPGPTATDLFLNGKSEEMVKGLANLAPLERLGTPKDIAAVVSFLAGEDGGWINGQILRANGGIV